MKKWIEGEGSESSQDLERETAIELLHRLEGYMDDRADILEVGDSYGEQRPNAELSFVNEIKETIYLLTKKNNHERQKEKRNCTMGRHPRNDG